MFKPSTERLLYDSETTLRLIAGMLDELDPPACGSGEDGRGTDRGLAMIQVAAGPDEDGFAFFDPEVARLAAEAWGHSEPPASSESGSAETVLSRLNRALTLVDQLDLGSSDSEHRRRLICSGLRDEILSMIDDCRRDDVAIASA